MQRPSPILRKITRQSLAGIVFPDVGPTMTFPPRCPPNFDMFYNPPIKSTLCLPSSWYSFEFGQEIMKGLTQQYVISGREDVTSLGYFNTGVTFYLFRADTIELADKLAEGLRAATLRECRSKIGGSTSWLTYPDFKAFSMRYSSAIPEMKAPNGQILKARDMTFIQDIVFSKDRKMVFVMKFETPSEQFNDCLDTFKIIKTSGYYAIDNDNDNDNHDHNTISNGNSTSARSEKETGPGLIFTEL